MQRFTKNVIILTEGVNMNDLFENISKANKEKLLKILEATTLTFQKNINICSTINDKNMIAIIDYGYIQIIRNDYNGNRTIIEDLMTNDIFGNIIFPLSNQEYDIITKEETRITLIDYSIVMNEEELKYSYYHQFVKNLLKLTIHKISEKNDRIKILTKKTIRDKLLEYFKIISKKNGSKIIYLPSTFTELADYLAVDRSAMSRELKYLKEEGFIQITNKKIILLY